MVALGEYCTLPCSLEYLRDNSELVCLDTANYLTMWCVNLEVQEVRGRGYMHRWAGSFNSSHTHTVQKSSLMKRVSHQTIVMQYILELAKQLERDPRSCVPGFFIRWV